MKTKILEAFKNLGFEMEDMEELGYGFEYEDLHYLWMNYEDDEFLRIAVPAVCDKPEDYVLDYYQVINKLNSTLKYVKTCEVCNSIWFFYEREIVGEEDFEKLLPKIILHLEHAVRFLRSGGHETSNDENDGEVIRESNDDDDDHVISDVDLLNDNDENNE